MQIKVFSSENALAECAADYFEKVLTEKPNAVLGLATGASPVATYRELIRRYRAGKISFAQATTFNLDEYCDLPQNDKNSYYSFMQENLFRHVDINQSRVNIENGNAKDFDEETRAYRPAASRHRNKRPYRLQRTCRYVYRRNVPHQAHAEHH